MTQTVTKVLAGQEDFAIGQGPIVQTRQGAAVSIKQIDLNWIFQSRAEITALDITKYAHASFEDDSDILEYYYDSSSSAVVDGVTVLLPDLGVGRWLLQLRDASVILYDPLLTGSAERTVTSRLSDTISIRDFQDVDGTGVADSTVGFTAAIAWAMLSGQALELVSGDTYSLDTWTEIVQTGALTIFCKVSAEISCLKQPC